MLILVLSPAGSVDSQWKRLRLAWIDLRVGDSQDGRSKRMGTEWDQEVVGNVDPRKECCA